MGQPKKGDYKKRIDLESVDENVDAGITKVFIQAETVFLKNKIKEKK